MITSEKILMKRLISSNVGGRPNAGRGPIKTAILWPLVLYSLIQIAANLIQDNWPNNQNDIGASNNINSHHDQSTLSLSSCSRSKGSIENWLLTQENTCSNVKSQKSCSSAQEISSQVLLSPLKSSANHYLSSLLQIFNRKNERTIFGGKILMAQASASFYHPNQDKEIIILNSTNFNTELIQHKFPFPHIKLIEYYLSFCIFCSKFKTTYTKLAKEIYPWRNVIRTSAIDLGIANNSPIAHSWFVDIVPTLRLYPPPGARLAEKLDKQLLSWNATLTPSELQKSLAEEYKNARLMLHTLNAVKYLDNVPLLKSDILLYVERYVRVTPPTGLPVSWPNLQPVAETTLAKLRKNHPRQELFLIIEHGARRMVTSGSDQSLETASLGLTIMMELSSSTAWKAIRYVNASENRALIEDVIAQQKRAGKQSIGQNGDQTELLNNLLSEEAATTESNNIVLVHIDDSHSPARTGATPSVSVPFLTIVTGTNLMSMEQSILNEQQASHKVRRETNQARTPRSLFSSEGSGFNDLSNERRAELMAFYIKQTYTETSEDRDFVKAIDNFDENSSSKVDNALESSNSKAVKKLSKVQQTNLNQPSETSEQDSFSPTQRDQSSMLSKIYSALDSADKKDKQLTYSFSSDYDDKLKAVRYILFNEVPRTSMADKSLVEQQEKLNTLVNLVTVIKSYFPLPDLPSIQFIDGVHNYLLRQQSRLLSVNTQERGTSGFDTRAFKQELKRLENEDKRLPEIKEWKHCKITGYPCALWRLFHTLVAFEYKKLIQIRQPSSQVPPTLTSTVLHQLENNVSPTVEAITMNRTTSSNGPPSPVERLVSPPSTTTSLSLTIATPTSSRTAPDSNSGNSNNNSNNNYNKPLTEADLPMPVILVMRDYITTFFSCKECGDNFRTEAADLNLEKIRQQEPAEFSILWLWETHNRVNKRLSVDPETNPRENPKVWFPTYEQCTACYNKPPSFLQDTAVDATIFHEAIDWNKYEVLCFLLHEYTKQPMDNHTNIFGYQVPYGFGYIFVTCVCCLVLIVVLRCTTYYIERQRRHKATLLNGNGGYSIALQ